MNIADAIVTSVSTNGFTMQVDPADADYVGVDHSGVFVVSDATVARGDRVELRGFGAFSVKERPARTGRNPRTGAPVSVDAKRVPFFKTGKELREQLNKSGEPDGQ